VELMMRVGKQLAAVCISGFVVVGLMTASATARPAAHQVTLSVVKITSAPNGRGPLSHQYLNTVPVHPNLSFKVVIRNGTAPQNLKVTLRISGRPTSVRPIEKTKAVALGANQMASVTFGKLGPIAFAQRETLKLTIADARTREQWNIHYPVIFSLG
jgi:hypothetical protein